MRPGLVYKYIGIGNFVKHLFNLGLVSLLGFGLIACGPEPNEAPLNPPKGLPECPEIGPNQVEPDYPGEECVDPSRDSMGIEGSLPDNGVTEAYIPVTALDFSKY